MVKLRDDSHSFVVQLHQRWNDRLDFPPTKLSKRYIRGELAVTLELNCEIDGSQPGMLALVTFKNDPHILRNLPRANAINQEHFSVLVDNVETVKDGNGGFGRVGGVVRLESFDKVEDFGVCN